MSENTEHNDEQVSPSALREAFNRLQEKLPAMWSAVGSSDPGGQVQAENTVVVVPSISIDQEFPTVKQQAFEERFLFMLFILGQPHLRLIYATSQAIKPEIIDYYLDVLPGAIFNNARRRLFLVSPEDGSSRPLSQKLLQRPRLIEQIKELIPDPDNASLVPYNTTDLERELAVRLGIPMYAADPEFFAFGTKSGSRQLFAEEGINHPLGVENLYSEQAAVEAIANMRARKPEIARVFVKLNEGIGGMGNAMVDLTDLPEPGHPEERNQIVSCFQGMHFEVTDVDYKSYLQNWQEHGGIVEEFVGGAKVYSPSVQMRNTPLGEVEILSTHDQLLGGPTGQTFLGAMFPARAAYFALITREAHILGRRLANEGVIGRYAVDFLLIRDESGEWQSYAIEINLRKGGTTTPYLILQYLTRGRYDPDTGCFRTLHGNKKFYVASDHLDKEAYRVFTPSDLFDVLSDHRLHFDHTSQTGIVLHMISGVGTYGAVGVTAIADSPDEAQRLYQRLEEVLDVEAADRRAR